MPLPNIPPDPRRTLKSIKEIARGKVVYSIEADLVGKKRLSDSETLKAEITAGTSTDTLVQKCFDFADAVIIKALNSDTPDIDKAITEAKSQLEVEIKKYDPKFDKSSLDALKMGIITLVTNTRTHLRSKGQDLPGIG